MLAGVGATDDWAAPVAWRADGERVRNAVTDSATCSSFLELRGTFLFQVMMVIT